LNVSSVGVPPFFVVVAVPLIDAVELPADPIVRFCAWNEEVLEVMFTFAVKLVPVDVVKVIVPSRLAAFTTSDVMVMATLVEPADADTVIDALPDTTTPSFNVQPGGAPKLTVTLVPDTVADPQPWSEPEMRVWIDAAFCAAVFVGSMVGSNANSSSAKVDSCCALLGASEA
jgi:hypothetical protein